ncbi:MAG TPA: 50S ribosomal protein L18 [candidate division Zixibacteria bacterium]|nr:50S ribosomal protein L18 [candidate division Zixibacteria bacterium]
MADKNTKKAKRAVRRRRRVRGKVFGTAECPRLTVAKSLNNIFVQIIDDEEGRTLIGTASNAKDIKTELKDDMSKVDVAKLVGQAIARKAKEQGIETVVFDRNMYLFHGRIKAVAEGAREGGLKF